MNNTLNVGKAVYYLLSHCDELVQYVKDKIYPLIADEGTTYPFIIYRRNSIEPESNKDYTNESDNIEIYVVTDTYEESVEVAQLVRQALEHKKGSFSNIEIEDITLRDASEDFIDNAFIQILNFNIELNY